MLENAVRLFEARGYDNVTVAEIADAAGWLEAAAASINYPSAVV